MKDDLEQNIYWLLIRSSIPAKQVFVRAGELFGLTHMQLFTLCLIDKDGETPMSEITCALGCDASNVTGLTEKLVGSGFVERTESPRDRRIKLIRLTKKGKQTRESILNDLAGAKLNLLSELSEEEKADLRRLLIKVVSTCPGTRPKES